MLSNSKDFLSNIENVIHEKTQVHKKSIELTVKNIFEIKNAGSLDFGGSEVDEAEFVKISVEKKSEKDKYGWWHLEQGVYLVEFNEKLTRDYGLVQSISRLLLTGCFIPMQIFQKNDRLQNLLVVGDNGVDIKENARIAGFYHMK
jgi:deoxycytidine triphosphate deaminase